MNRHNRIHFCFCQRTNYIGHTLLHFGIGTLHGVQFHCVVIMTCIHRRHSATTHTDAIIITTHHHDLLSYFGRTFQGIFAITETDTTGQHDNLVVAIFLIIFLVFKSQQRTTNERLTKFVTEVGSSV
ncbi:hypothetical protein SDC9_64746 [bioreactor metagenome]|uniref:Uncharacterized protein n=1 Tax=bioreactor metagenome TaxID=1076179 RepID=A0A644XR10_9ZZZZ